MNANNEITLEVCTNTEWLRENCLLNLDVILDGAENEAADAIGDAIMDRLASRGYQIERARGQRTQYHGWNGANTFAHKLGPVGTFDRLTGEQIEEIEAAIGEAREVVASEYAA